ncbi:hypothetical protein [Phenylobacterium sp.]|jgi:hypothetical protein|uniref:hypothetical protein n=1 Tax=Phenylobacterium sp. TaxID=1871053 RepID=UPI002E37F172|nr:hypothetical protein [Phenylobacterium sp.]HEX2560364.1 hypothetical protein [Phenylobacterium sp.]
MAHPRERPAAAVRPGPRARLLIYGTGLGLWISGGLWLVFHYFLRREGAWGPEPHELEPWWLRLHGAFAFLALWTAGLLWGVHVARAWSGGRRRLTGALMLGGVILMAVTGFLLLHAGDDGLQGLISPTHWVVGLALPLLFLAHRRSQ